MPKAATVCEYIENAERFRPELEKLRGILTSTEFEETIKWGAPCYTIGGKNVVGLAAFKSYVGLWFHNGALMSDPDGVFVNAQEGKTKALRQWRFTSAEEIEVARVRAYLKEAIALQKAGKEIRPEPKGWKVDVPPELAGAMDAKTKRAFDALTPGKRREYANHVAEAKRDETKAKRVEKILPMIRAGAGLHDKYRSC